MLNLAKQIKYNNKKKKKKKKKKKNNYKKFIDLTT